MRFVHSETENRINIELGAPSRFRALIMEHPDPQKSGKWQVLFKDVERDYTKTNLSDYEIRVPQDFLPELLKYIVAPVTDKNIDVLKNLSWENLVQTVRYGMRIERERLAFEENRYVCFEYGEGSTAAETSELQLVPDVVQFDIHHKARRALPQPDTPHHVTEPKPTGL